MSQFYDQASLVMVPSGYKSGKIYSQKPLSTSGELSFSRASNATRVNSSGLVERVRTNEARYSEDQTNWTDQNETSVTANTAANPLNGAVTADKVVPSVIPTDHYRGLSMATLIGEFSVSIYVKADGYDFFDFGVYNSTALAYAARATFDLSTATYSLTSGTSASITSVGSGWYRVSMLASVASSSALSIYHRVRPTGGTGVYSGDGTSGMLLWGCQLESGVLTPYIGPTTSTSVSVGPVSGLPRLDYTPTLGQSGGGGASCCSLLLEPQRTNVATFSEQFDNAAWTKVRSTITANGSTSPDGYANADLLVAEASSNDHFTLRSATASIAQSFSVFAKAGGYNYVFVGADNVTTSGVFFNLTNGTISQNTSTLTAKIEDYGNGWYRCSVSSASWPAAFALIATSANGTALVHTGNGTSGVYIWGAQLEAGAYATSYIPTLSSAVTRVNERAQKTGIGSLIGGTSGTIFYEIHTNPNMSNASYKQLFYYIDASALQGYAFVDSANVIKTNANLGNMTASIVLAQDTTYKIAIAYAPSDFKLYVNGAEVASSTSGTPKDFVDILSIGSYAGASEWNEFGFKQILHFKTRLSNADLATLTSL